MESRNLSQFQREEQQSIEEQSKDSNLAKITHDWILRSMVHRYTYHFSVLGRPIIQFPQDIVALQEIVWKVKPDLIVETGIAHGGSLMLSAGMLALLDYCEAAGRTGNLGPSSSRRRVVGVDIEIRPHNRVAIEEHPMSGLITMIEGSSVAPDVIEQVQAIARDHHSILVCLDSNHTHQHVYDELRAYATLVTKGSYCVVSDTIIENLPDDRFADRPWSRGNNPRTAVERFLENDDRFEIDLEIDSRLLISNSPCGYLRRIKD